MNQNNFPDKISSIIDQRPNRIAAKDVSLIQVEIVDGASAERAIVFGQTQRDVVELFVYDEIGRIVGHVNLHPSDTALRLVSFTPAGPKVTRGSSVVPVSGDSLDVGTLAGLSEVEEAPFSPLDLEGLMIWLDATNPGAAYADGNPVTVWSDLSGNGNHAVIAGAVWSSPVPPVFKNNVIGVLPAIGFAVADNPLFGASSPGLVHLTNIGFSGGDPITDWSDYFVVKVEDPSFIGVLSTIDGWYNYFTFGGNPELSGGGLEDSGFTPGVNTSWLYSYRFDSAASTIKFRLGASTNDGVDAGFFASSDDSADTYCGVDQFGESFFGYIAERISVNRKLTDAEDILVRAYLADKWGVAN